MREGIGSVMLYNIIIVFIVIIFAIIAGTTSYAKAFKVNSQLSKAIEMFEGYNQFAYSNYPQAGGIGEVNRVLKTLGYQVNNNYHCPSTWSGNGTLANVRGPQEINYKVCFYNFPKDKMNYYEVGIVSYMQIDIPVFGGKIEIPIFSKTKKMYVWK